MIVVMQAEATDDSVLEAARVKEDKDKGEFGNI